MFMRTDYFQAFLFQKCIAEILKSARFYILLEELQFFKRCSQTTVSLHAPRLPAVYTPSSLQLNPQETFFLENMHVLQEGTRTRILPTEV